MGFPRCTTSSCRRLRHHYIEHPSTLARMNESNPIEEPPLIPSKPKRVWLYILLVGAIVLSVPAFFAVAWFFIRRPHVAPRSIQAKEPTLVIASFQADFQPDQPREGWHYYWNASGPVGDTNAYAALHWNGN